MCDSAEPDNFPDRRDLHNACRSITEGPEREARDLFRHCIRRRAFRKASRACGRLAETLRGVRRSHDAAQALRLCRPMPGSPDRRRAKTQAERSGGCVCCGAPPRIALDNM